MSGKTFFIDENGIKHRIKKLYYISFTGQKRRIKKDYYEGNKITFSDSHIVTYQINADDVIEQEVDDGEDIIEHAPIVSYDDWNNYGWRNDQLAKLPPLDEEICEDDGMTVYALLKKDIAISYNANGGTGTTAPQTGTAYYNNGNTLPLSVTLKPAGTFTRPSGVVGGVMHFYTFNRWRLNSTSGTAYAAGAVMTAIKNCTMYAEWTDTYYHITMNGFSSHEYNNNWHIIYLNQYVDVFNITIDLGKEYNLTSYIYNVGLYNDCSLLRANGTKVYTFGESSGGQSTERYERHLPYQVNNVRFITIGLNKSWSATAWYVLDIYIYSTEGVINPRYFKIN